MRCDLERYIIKGHMTIIHSIVCSLSFFSVFLMVCGFVSELSQDTSLVCRDPEGASKELFLPFRCFCTRKDVSFSV